jgi:hypothetical protein
LYWCGWTQAGCTGEQNYQGAIRNAEHVDH